MKTLKHSDQIDEADLVYWIDKQFVHDFAKKRIGRKLDETELQDVTKMLEFGLWEAVRISLSTAIDEASKQ